MDRTTREDTTRLESAQAAGTGGRDKAAKAGMELSDVEARVLGALMEKEVTTPEYYPLSLNALVAACNQKSSREPVMTVSEREVEMALRSLEGHELIRAERGAGGGTRVERFENRARTVFHLRRDEAAVLCLLLLRGPQTPGELRGRAERLFQFEDVAQVNATLQRMSAVGEPGSQRAEPLVRMLARQAGAREARYVHLLSGTPAEAATAPTNGNGVVADVDRMRVLEEAVQALTERVRVLEERLGSGEAR